MSVEMSAKCKRLDYTGAKRAVLLEYADHANDDGICWPSRSRIMYNTGLSESAVKQHTRELREAEVIKVVAQHEGGRGRIPIYKVQPEKGPRKPPFKEWLKGLSDDPKRGQSVTPEPSIENHQPNNPPVAPPKGGARPKRARGKDTTDYARLVEEFVERDPLGGKLSILMDLAAEENKSKAMTWSRRWNEFCVGLQGLREESHLTDAHLRYGLVQAIKNEAPNMNYVKKAAERLKPGESDATGAAPIVSEGMSAERKERIRKATALDKDPSRELSPEERAAIERIEKEAS